MAFTVCSTLCSYLTLNERYGFLMGYNFIKNHLSLVTAPVRAVKGSGITTRVCESMCVWSAYVWGRHSHRFVYVCMWKISPCMYARKCGLILNMVYFNNKRCLIWISTCELYALNYILKLNVLLDLENFSSLQTRILYTETSKQCN